MQDDNLSAHDELAEITSLAASCRNLSGLTVDIGFGDGQRATALANACQPDCIHVVGAWKDTTIESRDPPAVRLNARENAFSAFCDDVQLRTQGNVVLHQSDHFEWLRIQRERIKFCHIDVSHDYESMRRMIELAWPMIVPGGVICGRGLQMEHEGERDLNRGVERAVREMLPGYSAQGDAWWLRTPSRISDCAIYDCFMFFNEFELLDLRLRELSDVVDRFVLVEATTTHAGYPKLLLFDRFRHLFQASAAKIIYVPVRDDIAHGNSWDREFFQRNAIMHGLVGAAEEDIILISDVDEIPCRQAVERLRSIDQPVTLRFAHHYYGLDCRLQIPWDGTVATRRRLLRLPQIERDERGRIEHMLDAGWHFSFLGGATRIRQKLRAYSHTELDRLPFNTPEWIGKQISEGKDLFGRPATGFPPTFVDLERDERYSEAVRAIAREHPYLARPRAS